MALASSYHSPPVPLRASVGRRRERRRTVLPNALEQRASETEPVGDDAKISRRECVRLVGSLSSAAAFVVASSASASTSTSAAMLPLRAQLIEARSSNKAPASTSTTVPITLEGGTFVASFKIGAARLRAVVDSGSPFLTTRMACDAGWGCLSKGDVRFNGAFGNTYETYGLQVDGRTEWATGDCALGDWNLDEVVFGVTDDVRGQNTAPFLGLVKYTNRERGIRPSFLQQTDAEAFSLDFERETLTISTAPLFDASDEGVLRTVDLRPRGAPVYHYAVACDELWINGERYRSRKPIYCVFDTGTTGVLVSRDLYEASDFHLGTYQMHAKFTDTNGETKYAGSSLKTCLSVNDCVFIVSPIDVPWKGVGSEYHVIFLGLAALRNQGELAVDTERGLVRLGRGRRTPPLEA